MSDVDDARSRAAVFAGGLNPSTYGFIVKRVCVLTRTGVRTSPLCVFLDFLNSGSRDSTVCPTLPEFVRFRMMFHLSSTGGGDDGTRRAIDGRTVDAVARGVVDTSRHSAWDGRTGDNASRVTASIHSFIHRFVSPSSSVVSRSTERRVTARAGRRRRCPRARVVVGVARGRSVGR